MNMIVSGFESGMAPSFGCVDSGVNQSVAGVNSQVWPDASLPDRQGGMGAGTWGCGGRLLVSVIAALGVAAGMTAPASAAPLSAERSPVAIDSTYGSGSFGSWGVD